MSFQDSEAKWKGERERHLGRTNEAASPQWYIMGHKSSFDLTQSK